MFARFMVLILTALMATQAASDLVLGDVASFAADLVPVVIGCFFLGYRPPEKVK